MKTLPHKKIKVKICGITSIKDGLAVAKLAPEYMGFIINYPKSPRNMEPTKVKEIISAVKKISKNIKFVGVFADQSPVIIKKIVKVCELDITQLHGQESISDVMEIKKVCEVWKSVIIKDGSDVENSKKYKGVADKILFDAGAGSGNKVDLKLLEKERIDILAGGLGVETIDNALVECQPSIVDSNSKLEESPGKKDIKKVKEFIRKVRIYNK